VRPAPSPGPVRARLLAEDAVEPEGAFDALYREAAGPLRRQVYVLTGDRELAGEAVGRAFDTAWQQWPEVARDSDPVGWLRAAAHTYALAPWQGLWQRARRRERPPVPECAWWRALLRLPPERRRALLLHDGLGMSLARTAAEVEAGTTAAASRVIAARRALAAAAPEEYDGGDAGGRLAGLLDAAPADELPAPEGVREASERAARRRTYASFGAAGAVLLLTTVCMVVAPQPVDRPDDGPARQHAAQSSSPAGLPAP
jgi:DNA-directed RNA polymerase specialized sigma24 family protein